MYLNHLNNSNKSSFYHIPMHFDNSSPWQEKSEGDKKVEKN